ncbi:cobalamin biosynthesis protein CobW [Flavobacterium sp. 7A]|uniref:cobalamin biosynthesis protein CobW n=1 Tax=Flavobacterium sp. 7A TaxID=2940571 RepID=UPI00222702B5|nr:cobalamin biosynthesis protein CobW [Flavobacterium sp. 7A]MCW2119685.1 cobalamin biosynthesis protein CobW [Flavobacterium sp. 7A]
MRKIPITIVTGFLGVGKTTLVHNMIKNANGKRIAVLVNEFGEVDVDGELIKGGCEDDACNLVELPNGCICCTVQEEFLPTMLTMIERKDTIDHIVIETSGLSMPKPLVKAVNWPDLKPHITVDAVITVVDAVGVVTGELCDRELVQAQRLADETLDHDTSIEELFLDQLACADLVLLSKTDLVAPERLEEVLAYVKSKARSTAKIIPMVNGMITNEVLLGIEAAGEDNLDDRISLHERHHELGNHHHHNDDMHTVMITETETADIKVLVNALKKRVQEEEIYRIKGFVNIPNKAMRMVLQGVGERFDYYFDRAWKEGELRQTRLVVIGRNIDPVKKAAAHAHDQDHDHDHNHSH